MAELDRAQAEQFNRSLVAAALDVFSDPESIVQHVEDAADDVLDQGLRAEADRDAEYARAGDQRPYLHAQSGKNGENGHGGQSRRRACFGKSAAMSASDPGAPPPAG